MSFIDYEDDEDGLLLYDTGHTGKKLYPDIFKMITVGFIVQISVPTSSHACVKKGGLPDKYDLAQLHFHWADEDHEGSEHTIAGLSYPLEVSRGRTVVAIDALFV